MTSSLPTGIQLTALDTEFREDPYPVLAELREHDPIHHDTQLGRYFFTRHDDVAEILRDPKYWSDPRKGKEGGFARGYLGRGDEEPRMLMMDDPGHRRLRNLVSDPFRPRAVERWRMQVRKVANGVTGAVEEGEFDLIADVADLIPTIVIANKLGVDSTQHAQFKTWSAAALKVAFSPINAPEDLLEAEKAFAGLRETFTAVIERRRREPREDLVSAMIAAEDLEDRLTDDEIAAQCELLLLAGNVTTTDLIGNTLMALLRNSDQLEKLRAQPELLENTIDEVLRYDTPVTDTGRIANRDIEIRGVKIEEGESMTASLAGANRDPGVYPEPDRFDIERKDTHHQSFGGGRHFCLGSHLARIEAQETLSSLLSRFSRLTLVKDDFEYAENPSLRGFAKLRVRAEY
jgi:cytochrome P450